MKKLCQKIFYPYGVGVLVFSLHLFRQKILMFFLWIPKY